MTKNKILYNFILFNMQSSTKKEGILYANWWLKNKILIRQMKYNGEFVIVREFRSYILHYFPDTQYLKIIKIIEKCVKENNL